MSLIRYHPELRWLSFRQTLKNGVESINVILSMSNRPALPAVTISLPNIAVALDALAFLGDKVA